jgi:hypothetical protein
VPVQLRSDLRWSGVHRTEKSNPFRRGRRDTRHLKRTPTKLDGVFGPWSPSRPHNSHVWGGPWHCVLVERFESNLGNLMVRRMPGAQGATSSPRFQRTANSHVRFGFAAILGRQTAPEARSGAATYRRTWHTRAASWRAPLFRKRLGQLPPSRPLAENLGRTGLTSGTTFGCTQFRSKRVAKRRRAYTRNLPTSGCPDRRPTTQLQPATNESPRVRGSSLPSLMNSLRASPRRRPCWCLGQPGTPRVQPQRPEAIKAPSHRTVPMRELPS